jgi:hypothetical protein
VRCAHRPRRSERRPAQQRTQLPGIDEIGDAIELRRGSIIPRF